MDDKTESEIKKENLTVVVTNPTISNDEAVVEATPSSSNQSGNDSCLPPKLQKEASSDLESAGSSSPRSSSSQEKKVILLNPIAINMLKSAPKPASGDGSRTTDPVKQEPMTPNAPPGTVKVEGPNPAVLAQSMEYLKHFQALASALKSEPKKKVFCANTNCNMKTDTVIEAPPYAKLYFGMSGSSTTSKICLNCFRKAELFNEKSKTLVNNKENLFDLSFEIQTAASESVVDLDSPDSTLCFLENRQIFFRWPSLEVAKKKSSKMGVVKSDSVGSPASLGTSDQHDVFTESTDRTCQTYSISVAKLEEFIRDKLQKFDINSQVTKCAGSVTTEVEDLTFHFQSLDSRIDDLRGKIEGATKAYNDKIAAKSKVVEIGTVEIDYRGAITVRKADNLENIEGISRQGSKALNKALADLKTVEELAGTPEMQMIPQEGLNTTNTRRMGKLIFVKPKEGQDVYAMHKHALFYWLPAKILHITHSTTPTRPSIYRVQFNQKVNKPRYKDDPDQYVKDVTGKQLAFKKPCQITLPVGTRIIAKFKDLLNTDVEVDGMFYAGIVAEVPRDINKFRYLIFFDDGYAQYVTPLEVVPVVESSPDVWVDVHKNSQDFIKDYIMKFPDRHMIRAERGATFTVELNGQWLFAKIVDLDGSLMKVQYLKKTDGIEFEWIYRGSTRLGPLFSRLKSLQAKPTLTVARRHTYSSRRTGNFSFEVNRIDDDEPQQVVAKKHTGFDPSRVNGKQPVIRAKNGMVISTVLESEGNMIKIQIPRDCPSPRPYVPHSCSIQCAYRYEEEKYRKVSPLAIPFYLGWAREVAGTNRDKIYYHTPCGVRCGNYQEIHSYITLTCACIPIDFFSMEPNIDCLNEFEPLRRMEFLKDISYGKEWTPVTCVNSLDRELPSYMEYITARIPGKGVVIHDDPGFMTCCDCEDDCQDKDKCACWQLTLSGISFKIAEKEGIKLQGYENRRLKNHVLSGIYECNRNCKCRSTCFNRVVQNKVKWPIQLFKTVAKGWGVRALHDMPQGSFICVYTGQLLTDEMANASGIQAGDEYLAELDFIECNEQIKEDYESDCTDIENEEPGTRSRARQEKAANSMPQTSEPKKQDVAKKSTAPTPTVQKAVKSTGGLKRKTDDGYSSAGSPGSQTSSSSTSSRPVARKSGSKNGAANLKNLDISSVSDSSGVASPSSVLSKRSRDDSDSDDDDGVHAYSSFSASTTAKNQRNAPRLPLREYFGKEESVYIMDAKSMGNFGRYLNHSCDPNVFVQNLFVDTHDPRFPWVAFFTRKDVKAGTELTWDYNYDIGSVPGKTLYCYCLQPGCRGRLL